MTAQRIGTQVQPLTAKGDLLGFGAGTVARVPVGSDGTTLLADSTSATGVSYQPLFAAGKNKIINADFGVWQRGTSISIPASQTYTSNYNADRWQLSSTGANEAFTISRQATNDTTNLPNIQYCARYQRNSGQTGTTTITTYQSFETVNSIPFVGKTVTLSFYARAGANFSASSNALLYAVQVSSSNTDANAFNAGTSSAPINSSATLTTTWQRFTATATIPTSTLSIQVGFGYTPTGTASTNDYFEITGVQLEAGSVATPFTTATGTVQGELAACQRYYWRKNAFQSYGTMGIGYVATGTTTFEAYIPFPVTMRTYPAFNSSAASTFRVVISGAAPAATALAALNLSQIDSRIDFTTSGLTTGYGGEIQSNNTTSSYLEFSAEL